MQDQDHDHFKDQFPVYMVIQQVSDLGWVDFTFVYSIVSQILLSS